MEELKKTAELFRERFGGEPEVISFAPSRVNVIGEHTDYNQGYVMPAALNRVTVFAGRRRQDRKAVVYSTTLDKAAEWEVDTLQRSGDFSDYLKGVLKFLPERTAGFEAAVYSTVPLAAGVSSSAALEVAFVEFVNALYELGLERSEIVEIAHKAESQFVGVRCGIMDQFIAAFAVEEHLLLIDTRSLSYEPIPFPSSWVLSVVNSNVKRELASSEYNRRRAECEEAVRIISSRYPQVKSLRDVDEAMLVSMRKELPDVLFRRAMHVVSENQRVLDLAEYLKKRDYCMVEKIMALAHQSLAQDYEVSIPEIDFLVEKASSLPFVHGARLTGAGFGGSIVVLLERGEEEKLVRELSSSYRQRFGREAGFIFSRPFRRSGAVRWEELNS